MPSLSNLLHDLKFYSLRGKEKKALLAKCTPGSWGHQAVATSVLHSEKKVKETLEKLEKKDASWRSHPLAQAYHSES